MRRFCTQAPWAGRWSGSRLTCGVFPCPEVETPALLGDMLRWMRHLLAQSPDRYSLSSYYVPEASHEQNRKTPLPSIAREKVDCHETNEYPEVINAMRKKPERERQTMLLGV